MKKNLSIWSKILWPKKKLFDWLMGKPVSKHVVETVKEIQTIHVPKVEPPQSPVKELKRKTPSTSSVGKLTGEVKDVTAPPTEKSVENTTTKPKSKRYKSRYKKRKPTNE